MKPEDGIPELVRAELDGNGELHLNRHKAAALVRWLNAVEKMLIEQNQLITNLRQTFGPILNKDTQ